jgi:phage shock protein E
MNSKILFIAAIAVVAVLVFRAMAATPSGTEKAAAKDKIKQGALVLDVRTAQEFSGGHYTGAKNIPVQELKSRLAEVGPTNKAVVVYCRSSNRSASAKKILLDAGYTDVTNAGALSDLQK